MADIVDSSGTLIPVSIPDFTEAADIQKALRIYHYGPDYVTTNSDATILTNSSSENSKSVAGYIAKLQADVLALGSGEIKPLTGSQNLNTYITSGVWHQDSAVDAGSGSNYPTSSQGLLSVKISDSYVYQTYQSYGNSSVSPQVYFRARDNNSSWSPWRQVSFTDHTHANYVTTTALTSTLADFQSKIAGPLTTVLTEPNLTGSAVVITDANGKIATTGMTISTTELGSLEGQTGTETLAVQLGKKASTTHADTHKASADGGTDPIQIAEGQVTGLTNKLNNKLSLNADNIGTNRDTFKKNVGIFVLNSTTYPTGPAAAGYTPVEGDLWVW